ncbi:hypothetical protein Tco_1531211 [Tanacetum coccineum]
MSAFIREFKTTNEILFKERNNSLSELRFEVYGLSKVINNALTSECKDKGVTTRGGKTTTEGILNDNTNIHDEGLSVPIHDEPDAPKEVLVEYEPQKSIEQVVQPSIEVQTPLILFPCRLRKEKEEAQQRKFLENQKQLHINFPFIETLAQMPKYTKFLKNLLTNKARLEEAYTVTMNERKITLRVGDDEVIFDVDKSIKRPPTEDDECYGIDDLDETINVDTQELLRNDQLDSFLLKALEKSINRADLESCDFIRDESGIDSDLGKPIRRIDPANTPYSVTQETSRSDEVKSEHLYSASADEIDEKKLELQDLPHHLEYAYLHVDKYFSIIISSKLSEKEKMFLLRIGETQMSFCLENVGHQGNNPRRGENEIVKLLASGLIYPISNSSWVSPIHVVPKKEGMTVVLNDNNELIPSRTVTRWILDGERILFGLCNAPATFQRCMTAIFHDMVEDFIEVFMDDFSVFEGIVLGHKISGADIEVDRAKIDVIAKLPYPTNVKGVRSCRHGWKLSNYAYCFWHPDISLSICNEFPLAFHGAVQPDAYNKLIEAGPQRWSRAHCPLTRYNYMTSNSVESNACTVLKRKLPITMLTETYRAMVQEFYFKRREVAANMKFLGLTDCVQFVADWFKKEKYQGTYAESIHFVGDMQEWEFPSHIHHVIPPRMDNP